MNGSTFSRHATVTALLAGAFAVTAWGAGSAPDKSVKLSGCLIRGEGNGSGYLLTNTPADPSLTSPSNQVKPSTIGTSGDYTTIFYWLDGNKDLEQHVGHRVDVEGDLKSAVKDGEIKTDRKDRWTELTVKADGRTMKAHVPNASVVPAADDSKDKKGHILVRRVDVDHVRMVSASCNEAH